MKSLPYTRPLLALVGAAALALVAGLTPAHAAPAPANQARHLDMVYVTLVKVTTEYQIGDYAADRGTRFVSVWLRAVNRNDVQKDIGAADFTLVSPSGNSIDQINTSPQPALASTTLDVGGRAYGALSFQVPAGMRRFTLRWAPAADAQDERWPSKTWSIAL